MNQTAAAASMVKRAPGTTPKVDPRSFVQLPAGADTGLGETVSESPIRRNSMPVVARTGLTLRTATKKPFIAPIPAARSRVIGIATNHSPRPAGKRTATSTQLTKVASGPTEMSIPPEIIDGVDANPTSTKGAKVVKSPGMFAGARKFVDTNMFARSKIIERKSANA
jgi:hypothetical protein